MITDTPLPFSVNGRFQKGRHWRPNKPWWDREWLLNEYISLQKSAAEIAKAGGCCENNILFWLHKHQIPTRDMFDVRHMKYWGSSGEANGMFGMTGDKNGNWRGGLTPERSHFYLSPGWKAACRAVYVRDNASCQRCFKHRKDTVLHVHHIVSFQMESLRAVVSNLVLLCEDCHWFVHSWRNFKDRLFLATVKHEQGSDQ